MASNPSVNYPRLLKFERRCMKLVLDVMCNVLYRNVMQVASDESAEMLYFVAPSAFLGDKRTAYARNLHFALSTFNESAPLDDVTTSDPGDDVIIRGVHVDFSLVARLPHSPLHVVTSYTVICLMALYA